MSKIKTFLKLLCNDQVGIIKAFIRYGNGYLKWIPDMAYLKIVFPIETGKKLNLDNPLTYNEKLQWIKLYDRKPLYIKLVDKYEVRKYVADMIGEQYLIKLIGVYENVDKIDFAKLPDEFILKCTHGSHCNILCRDKRELDIYKAKIKLAKWMKRNWFWYGREWPYRNVKPRIICEELLLSNGEIPGDYKVLCFNGKAKLIKVHINRFTDHKLDYYDINWNKTDITRNWPNSSTKHNRPELLEEMLQLSEILSQNTFHSRIDWYIVDNKLYFGEITFFDSSGFVNMDEEKYELMLGDWINLKIQ